MPRGSCFPKARGACVQARRRARWSMRTCILTAERVETDMGIMVGANARELEAIDSMSNERPRTGVWMILRAAAARCWLQESRDEIAKLLGNVVFELGPRSRLPVAGAGTGTGAGGTSIG